MYVITLSANGSPERVELSGGQFDLVKSSLDSVKRIRISRLDKSQPSVIMKTKGDTVTCSQALIVMR